MVKQSIFLLHEKNSFAFNILKRVFDFSHFMNSFSNETELPMFHSFFQNSRLDVKNKDRTALMIAAEFDQIMIFIKPYCFLSIICIESCFYSYF